MKKITIIAIAVLFLFMAGNVFAQVKKATTTKKPTTTTTKKPATAVKKPAPRAFVGTIGAKKIYLDEYKTMLGNYTTYMQNQSKGEKLTPQVKASYNNRLWEELVAKEAYQKDIKARGLTVTKAELNARIISNPPEQVKGIPALQTNGKFDPAKYKMAIEKDSVFKKNVGDVIMESYPYEKLFNAIKAQVKIKPDSVKNAWMLQNDKASAKVISFDWHTMKNITVADSEMSSYYQKNMETYKRDPARIIKYIKITFEPSAADSLESKTKADSIYQLVVAGGDFAELAKKYSQDPGSAQNGGDLGYFGRNRMVKEFEETAFGLEPGKVSAPFKTRFGWHIIKLIDKKNNEQGQEEVKASHILILFSASAKTKQDRKNDASQIYEKAKTMGLTKAIEGTTYVMQTSDEIYANAKYVPGIGNDENFVKDAFSKGKGALLELTTLPSGEMVIGEVADTLGVHFLTFASKKEEIKGKIEQEKSQAAANALALDFYSKYGPDKYLEQAQKDSLKIYDANDITISQNIPGIPPSKPLMEAIFKTAEGHYTTLITTDKGNWIALVTKRTPQETLAKDWEKNKKSEMKKAQDDAERSHLSQWYMKIKTAVNVVDNRKNYFDLEPKQ